ncbi:diaminopimelate epimerase [Fluviicola taffensis]|uniref:Diaminopimelate epimerase n=1 Tax=Fluviicola taffensis (strain DSM 16823 / NCIMB 13979 / RW262) TaxID=755732 RepID=F2IBQ3_FLUTR|nr:diaminopimelate epimerase [Fluviicola taffensis]AEA45379.1 Diaminopimelate epimerase [Fluviicola taffensis DSM 16823]
MSLFFVKYQGTGNDFVMIDNRSGEWDDLSISTIQKLCDRRFGVGADGLIKINSISGYDFEVDYYNSDGSKSFCGNGARCSVAFAHELGIIKDHVSFMAIDGVHEAVKKGSLVFLKMNDVSEIDVSHKEFVLNTGSPHFIHFTENVADFDIVSYGKQIRYSDTYKQEGINVNAIHQLDSHSFEIKTYERGVEDETLSCGTGVTAAAIALGEKNLIVGEFEYAVKSQGGNLAVRFTRENSKFTNIWLIGPAEVVFKGETNV